MLVEEHSETIVRGVRYKVSSIYNSEGKKDFRQLYQDIVTDHVLRHIERQSTGQDTTIIQVIFSAFASAAPVAATTIALFSQIGGR